jgi:hypothetical protein
MSPPIRGWRPRGRWPADIASPVSPKEGPLSFQTDFFRAGQPPAPHHIFVSKVFQVTGTA